MIEIHQSNYNPDELAWEVIESIIDLARNSGYRLSGKEGVTYDEDRALFERVANGDDSNETRDRWLGVEDYWQAWGRDRSIEVHDDGEAGWTYVGTSDEIEEFLNKQEEEA